MTEPSRSTSSVPPPRSGGSRLLIVLAGAAILAVVFGIVWMQSAKYELLTVGKTAPDFALTDLNDKPQRLFSRQGGVSELLGDLVQTLP
jgi:cytochrome c biogenesis protein CcmG, thiol:disulfide interchange protein DsbE